MANAFFNVPIADNEPVLGYAPGSSEKEELQAVYAEMKESVIDAPMFIGGEEVRTDNKVSIHPPHDHNKVVGHFNMGTKKHVEDAIDAALADSTKNMITPISIRDTLVRQVKEQIVNPDARAHCLGFLQKTL
ncbi:MAG: hypothetical protein HRT73_15040, partial [Flavobacteriales bacterium]|nr:hypothetical protein [Flavobacteriales bacterium]